MKLLLVSDIHARILPPENRTDKNFFEDVVLNKIQQIYQIAQSNKCDAILQAGDLFDSPDSSKFLISSIIKIMRQCNIKMYTVLGQHDAYYRDLTGVARTASYILESAGLVQIVGLDNRPVMLEADGAGNTINVYGMSFGQECNYKPDPDAHNILIAHATVGDRPLFPGHELPAPREFVHKHKGFNCYLLGDIHYYFMAKYGKSTICNTGVLIRKTTAEKEQKPCVIVYDTMNDTYNPVYLKYGKWQDVFNIDAKSALKSNDRLQEFLDAIKGNKKLSVSFEDNLQLYYGKNKVNDNVKKLISSMMEKANMSDKQIKELNHAG